MDASERRVGYTRQVRRRAREVWAARLGLEARFWCVSPETVSSTKSPAAQPEYPENLSGMLLVVARCGWMAMVAMAVGLFVFHLPHYYSHNVSTAVSTAHEHFFIEVGLTPGFIAAFVAARDTIVVGVFLAIALAILRRGTGNVIALFVSLMLVFTGVMTPRVLDAPMEHTLWP